jgi:mannose-1-phosphate guanylyltransferase/phosphomannomutase
MAITKKRLGELDAETPRLHSYQKSIQCPWNAKAKVMRLLMKDSERLPRELIDGVKLYFPKRSAFTSVFLSPDRTHPKFNITAESEDVSISQQLAEEYEQKLINWVKD